MSSKKKRQLAILNVCIIIINILLFSKAFCGLELFAGSAFTISLAWTAIITSILAFVMGNKALLKTREARLMTQDMRSLNDCLSVFEEAIHHGDVFDDHILKAMEQIKRFNRKQATIRDLLLQKFSADEISYQMFSGVLQDIENVVYVNMRSILNKISAFDVDEYEHMQRHGYQGDELAQERLNIFNEYIDFVNGAIRVNEDILLKLDRLLLEISRYNSLEDGDVHKLPAMMEMDELIKNANQYK